MNSKKDTAGKQPHGKVFDVMRPGKSPAAATSKPVIIGHKPTVQDRSVSMNGVGEHQTLLDARQKINLGPAPGFRPPVPEAAENKTLPETEAPSAAPTEPPAAAAPAPETAATPIAPPPLDKPTPNEPLLEEETPVQNGEASGAPSPAPAATSPAPETPAPQPISHTPETSAPLPPADTSDDTSQVAAETAAPDIGPSAVIVSHHRRSSGAGKILLAALLVIVLAVILLDVLLDTGIIKTALNLPHTHFLQR